MLKVTAPLMKHLTTLFNTDEQGDSNETIFIP